MVWLLWGIAWAGPLPVCEARVEAPVTVRAEMPDVSATWKLMGGGIEEWPDNPVFSGVPLIVPGDLHPRSRRVCGGMKADGVGLLDAQGWWAARGEDEGDMLAFHACARRSARAAWAAAPDDDRLAAAFVGTVLLDWSMRTHGDVAKAAAVVPRLARSADADVLDIVHAWVFTGWSLDGLPSDEVVAALDAAGLVGPIERASLEVQRGVGQPGWVAAVRRASELLGNACEGLEWWSPFADPLRPDRETLVLRRRADMCVEMGNVRRAAVAAEPSTFADDPVAADARVTHALAVCLGLPDPVCDTSRRTCRYDEGSFGARVQVIDGRWQPLCSHRPLPVWSSSVWDRLDDCMRQAGVKEELASFSLDRRRQEPVSVPRYEVVRDPSWW